MSETTVNRVSRIALMVLSLTALCTVLSGLVLQSRYQALPADENAGAHIFQLAIAALVPAIAVFLATADWTRPARAARPLAFAAAAVVAAFGALYYLEHYWVLLPR